jgi:hypothetical protein
MCINQRFSRPTKLTMSITRTSGSVVEQLGRKWVPAPPSRRPTRTGAWIPPSCDTDNPIAFLWSGLRLFDHCLILISNGMFFAGKRPWAIAGPDSQFATRDQYRSPLRIYPPTLHQQKTAPSPVTSETLGA